MVRPFSTEVNRSQEVASYVPSVVYQELLRGRIYVQINGTTNEGSLNHHNLFANNEVII